jgi:hypothetical protein
LKIAKATIHKVLAPSLNITSHTRIVVCAPVQQGIYEYYHCNKCTAASSYKNPILQQVTLANQEHTWKRERGYRIQFNSVLRNLKYMRQNQTARRYLTCTLCLELNTNFQMYISSHKFVPLMGGSWQTSKETTLLSQEIRQTQFCPNELPTYKTDENPKAHYTLWWTSKLFLTNCILLE